jgi:hypothetical protein
LIIVMLIAIVASISCGGNSTTASSNPAPSNPSNPQPTPQPNSCPAVTLAESTGPASGVAPFPAAAPLPPPSPGTTSAGSVCVSTPANNATVTSPTQIVAAASLTNPIDHMRAYVDGSAEYFTWFNTVNAQLWMANGAHSVEVIATDKSGNDVSTSFQLNVVAPQNPTISNIQNFSRWQPCGDLYPPGDPRAGQVCAAGGGNPVYTMTQDQSTPSLSGSSTMFTIGGPLHYVNELYTNYFAGGSNVTQFTYDLEFMVDQPDRPQALEFDVNQTIDNSRWVFGTECNFKGDGVWDVWDGTINKWVATSVPCKPVEANVWNHLVWKFERVGDQVHYISVELNGQTSNVDMYRANQPFWSIEDIDIAFQMDLDGAAEPYTVWLDQVTLSAN